MADGIKWIKISTDMFDNRKIKIIKSMPNWAEIIAVWVQMLCLAGSNASVDGRLFLINDIPYTDQMLSAHFGQSLQVIQQALNIFERLEMIEVVDDVYQVRNWEKYQNTDAISGYERRKLNDRERQKRKRERDKEQLLLSLNDKESRDGSRDVTRDVTEHKNKNKDIDNIDVIVNNNICAFGSENDGSGAVNEQKNGSVGVYSDSFEEVWREYPRKQNKGASYKAYKARLASGWSEEELLSATKKYASECRKNRTDQKYIKMASTFFSSTTPFEDYLPKDKEQQFDENNPFGLGGIL